jgi:hypothetical protein
MSWVELDLTPTQEHIVNRGMQRALMDAPIRVGEDSRVCDERVFAAAVRAFAVSS